MIQGKIESEEPLIDVLLFDWIEGGVVAVVFPDLNGEWYYDGTLPSQYGVIYRAVNSASRVEGPYT